MGSEMCIRDSIDWILLTKPRARSGPAPGVADAPGVCGSGAGARACRVVVHGAQLLSDHPWWHPSEAAMAVGGGDAWADALQRGIAAQPERPGQLACVRHGPFPADHFPVVAELTISQVPEDADEQRQSLT